MRFFEKVKNYCVVGAVSVYGEMCRKRILKDSMNIDKVSEKLLLDLVRKNRDTEYGKKYNFADIKTIKDYQDNVPFTTYDDYRGYIDRIAVKGEQGLLTSDRVVFFANTSGTFGNVKRIPVVKKATRPYTETVALYMNIISKEMRKRGFHCGKGLNTVETETNLTEGGIKEGLISAYTLKSAYFLIPVITCFPRDVFGHGEGVDMKYLKSFYALKDRDLSYIAAVFMSNITDLMSYIFENREMLLNDIEKGRINDSVCMPDDLRSGLNKKLCPDPERAQELREIFDTHSEKGIMAEIWKRLCVIIGIGTGEFECFAKKLREYCGEGITFYHETYSSSEALIANAKDIESDEYLLLTDSGFFEFIPVGEKCERPLQRHELEVGKLYEIVITNLSGLYRYRIRDVVRVTGFIGKNPLIHFAYRKNQVINITGVKLTSEQISDAVNSVEKTAGIHISDYAIYPDTTHSPWRLMLFLETEEELSAAQVKELSSLFDKKLSEQNHEHKRMLNIGETSPSLICQVKNNTFREYREYRIAHGASQNQLKTARVINDPEIISMFVSNTVSGIQQVKK